MPEEKLKGKKLEIPHCQKCEIFMILVDRANPKKGWICPKCGAANNPLNPTSESSAG